MSANLWKNQECLKTYLIYFVITTDVFHAGKNNKIEITEQGD